MAAAALLVLASYHDFRHLPEFAIFRSSPMPPAAPHSASAALTLPFDHSATPGALPSPARGAHGAPPARTSAAPSPMHAPAPPVMTPVLVHPSRPSVKPLPSRSERHRDPRRRVLGLIASETDLSVMSRTNRSIISSEAISATPGVVVMSADIQACLLLCSSAPRRARAHVKPRPCTPLTSKPAAF